MAVVVGTFMTQGEADDAVAALKEAGFSDGDLSVVSQTDAVDPPLDNEQRGGRAVDGATIGAAVGAVIGGALLGPVGAVLGGAAVGSGLAAALMSRGLAQREAEEYEAQLNAGRVVVAVEAGDRTVAAGNVLHRAGAQHIEAE